MAERQERSAGLFLDQPAKLFSDLASPPWLPTDEAVRRQAPGRPDQQ